MTDYRLEITRGTLIDEDDPVLAADVTSVGVTLGDAGGFSASYVVSCSGINSPKSSATSLTIADPDEDAGETEPDSETTE